MRYRINTRGGVFIGRFAKIANPKQVYLGKEASIGKYCLLCPFHNAKIIFGNNVSLGWFSRVTAVNEVVIGDNVITGPNVFIGDYNHRYEDIAKPISKQGITSPATKVVIGEDSWIGTNVVICGNVVVGRHVVIGAGSFVNKDIPDYSVAVGNPAKVVKKYNFETKTWERVTNK